MRGLLLAIVAFFLVCADTTFAPHVLLHNAQSAAQPSPLLWRATQQGSEEARAALIRLSRGEKKRYWLMRLAQNDDPQAAWALYELSGPDDDPRQLMRLAAMGNVPEAQLSYAMSEDDPAFREKWLKRAASQGLADAQAALADWYLLYDKPEKARPLLALIADNDNQSAYKFGRLLWDAGEKEAGREYLAKAAEQGNATAQGVLDVLKRYTQQPVTRSFDNRWPSECRQRIQMFADSLSTIQHADKLYRAFNDDPRLASLPLCLAKPLWLTSDTFTCDENWQQSQRLGCDIRPLAPAIERDGASHVVLLAQQGKANIDNGVMFLDIGDTYSVFVHELAHFAGFADEYPLSKGAAKKVCQTATQSVNESPNLVFDGRLTYAPMSVLERWLKLAPHDGIWPAKTCDGIKGNAYKPSSAITFMEHHDTGVIPPLYLALWKQQLEDKTRQRPVSMNLFQAFHHHGQTAQAGIWLERYQQAVAAMPDATGTPSATH
ncbi:sel1 repeat family protein [Alteromonas halophila]|uniref:Sel1 repeat family protein n=1 Tax=Alteromonas halophila TaxID=516698 RepID=A0A918JLC8_9ALTE|nr:sel1 repeat family protein [Alteromonas halophila]GGW87786.1 hypothetical protein GCM10007391_21900 [Alteromonas halophila]